MVIVTSPTSAPPPPDASRIFKYDCAPPVMEIIPVLSNNSSEEIEIEPKPIMPGLNITFETFIESESKAPIRLLTVQFTLASSAKLPN